MSEPFLVSVTVPTPPPSSIPAPPARCRTGHLRPSTPRRREHRLNRSFHRELLTVRNVKLVEMRASALSRDRPWNELSSRDWPVRLDPFGTSVPSGSLKLPAVSNSTESPSFSLLESSVFDNLHRKCSVSNGGRTLAEQKLRLPSSKAICETLRQATMPNRFIDSPLMPKMREL